MQEKEEQRMKFKLVNLDLQVHVSSLSASQMFKEEKKNSLQCEMDTRTWVSDEELKISMKGIVRGMEQEKHGQITYLLATVKMFLEEETKSLQSEREEKVNL